VNNDYLDPINAENMPNLVDNSLALDLLLSAKTGVTYCAKAITETTSPAVRAVLREILNDSLTLHRETAQLMMAKKWFHPYQLEEQHTLDVRSAETVVKIANMDLFPPDTSRLGLFATPNK